MRYQTWVRHEYVLFFILKLARMNFKSKSLMKKSQLRGSLEYSCQVRMACSRKFIHFKQHEFPEVNRLWKVSFGISGGPWRGGRHSTSDDSLLREISLHNKRILIISPHNQRQHTNNKHTHNKPPSSNYWLKRILIISPHHQRILVNASTHPVRMAWRRKLLQFKIVYIQSLKMPQSVYIFQKVSPTKLLRGGTARQLVAKNKPAS